MLSKAEIAYLKGELQVNDNYRWKLEHCIKKKLKRFEVEILPTLLANEKTRMWLVEKIAGYVNGWINLTGNGKALTGISKDIMMLMQNGGVMEKPEMSWKPENKPDNEFLLVDRAGLEPATFGLQIRRAFQAAPPAHSSPSLISLK